MKRLIVIILTASFLLICLCGCSSKPKIEELSQAKRIEVRIFSLEDTAYEDLVITDGETIKNISGAFSSLELKEVHIEKPRAVYCSLQFFKGNEQRPFESFTVGMDNRVETDSALYNITNDINLIDYLSNVFENASVNGDHGYDEG